MTREIKFRVWDDAIHDWHATKATTAFNDRYNKGYNFNIVGFGNPERTFIEQYTGLKDKNGTEIYEGDIVRADVRWFNGEPQPRYFSRSIVIFRQQAFMLADSVENTTHNEPLWNYASDEVEIIGNVHENPELLKKGEENE